MAYPKLKVSEVRRCSLQNRTSRVVSLNFITFDLFNYSKMQNTSESIESAIVEKLRPLNPIKIILFGSYAYGTPNANSDLDICVIKKEVKSKSKEKKEIREKLKDFFIAKDILVPSLEEYEFYKNQFGSVFMDIEQKGKLLWSAF
jgi:predicted nucleotidyltransferase